MSSERCRDLKKERRGEARTSTAWWTRAPCRPPVHSWTHEERPFPAVLARLCGCHLVAEPAVELEGGSVELVHLQREHALFTPATYKHLQSVHTCSESTLWESMWTSGRWGVRSATSGAQSLISLGKRASTTQVTLHPAMAEAPHVVQPELERRAFVRQRKEGLHRRRAVGGERRQERISCRRRSSK